MKTANASLSLKCHPRVNYILEAFNPNYLNPMDKSLDRHQVFIKHKLKNLCLGSIIHVQYITTTSHCLFNASLLINELKVYSGKMKFMSKVQNIHLHPEYNSINAENDVAILQLAKPTDIKNVIQLAYDWPFHKPCFATFWKDSSAIAERIVQTEIVHRETCNKTTYGRMKDGMFCARISKNILDKCENYIANFMVCDNKLAGIFSSGSMCSYDYPGIFTNVTQYVHFLKSLMQKNLRLKWEPKIVGGNEVTKAEDFSYQASVRVYNKHMCGGSIIDDHHVISAAHCVIYNDYTLSTTLYSVAVGDTIRDSNFQVRKVKNIFTHRGYRASHLRNDIALIRIFGTFEFGSGVEPIEISKISPKYGTHCVVSGWGAVTYSSRQYSDKLRFVKIDILDWKRCEKVFTKLYSGMLCAGQWEGKRDACQGDSGGPLVCNKQLIGITSWGKECGAANLPGIYTNVALYNDWIESQKARAHAARNHTNTYFYYIFYIIFAFCYALL